MNDVQFNAASLATHHRVLERRGVQAAFSQSDFGEVLAAETPAPDAAPNPPPALAMLPPPPLAVETPPSTAAPEPPASAAEAALKASPLAADLTDDQMALLLTGFGQSAAPAPFRPAKAAEAPHAGSTEAAPVVDAASATDPMSATRFFPIHRRDTGTPATTAKAEPEVAPEPITAEPAATPAAPAVEARFFPIDRAEAGRAASAADARDAYLRAMNMKARAMGAMTAS